MNSLFSVTRTFCYAVLLSSLSVGVPHAQTEMPANAAAMLSALDEGNCTDFMAQWREDIAIPQTDEFVIAVLAAAQGSPKSWTCLQAEADRQLVINYVADLSINTGKATGSARQVMGASMMGYKAMDDLMGPDWSEELASTGQLDYVLYAGFLNAFCGVDPIQSGFYDGASEQVRAVIADICARHYYGATRPNVEAAAYWLHIALSVEDWPDGTFPHVPPMLDSLQFSAVMRLGKEDFLERLNGESSATDRANTIFARVVAEQTLALLQTGEWAEDAARGVERARSFVPKPLELGGS